MTFQDTVLGEVLQIFKREGIEANSEKELVRKLQISPSTYREMFSDKTDLVKKVLLYDLEEQKREHAELLATAQNPVEEIMLLLKDGLETLKNINPLFYVDMQRHYPEVWQIASEHFSTYSYHELSNVINRGIIQNFFRKDVNLQLVTKIILEQLFILLNPKVFSPERYNIGEVFRSMFLYYLRGICTERGGKLAEDFFSKHNL
ncbi:TetR/AcrR family transcriptional regulator [Pontibacter silvestris]|uniref:TetR/AcrR family transcriptional regulator n=1 Tax=Pontibacter silvestris TaxID=2305183 RepID=A0ABW4X3M1_9BACT|nr:TetR/AcrR family transcriptional regulator [Pontibacter silvestris]MCC9135727.1 TetR/AcrR family transcriptional regulator [Pontibacter silvestris]